MPDEYPYFTPEAIEVATHAVHDEAKKWFGFSDRMADVSSAMGGMTLSATAFAVIDITGIMTGTDQSGAYTTTQEWLTSLFTDATGKMERFGDALNKCADEYDRTDGLSAKSFDTIATS
ncbi:hypothetical protein GCM10010435_40620 [Winogradskya consettensis]|uniref:Excreted virulence factor EspC (Type VII ESX diderm) n=1 Tax=Winogradskya consettensis TaxID=113560 RepID=A0A919SET4_9ACTN|nr:hypothetical protein [Actinoplanes consettensis]GIM69743.1 hypothetical protein Aco04nite_16750 [Actinoplanes consettensis]